MSRSIYVGVSNKAKKIKACYIGVGGKARRIRKVYVGDANGKARLCYNYYSINPEARLNFSYEIRDTSTGEVYIYAFNCPVDYTWQEFIDSSYNVNDLFTTDSGGVMDTINLDSLNYDNGISVSPSDYVTRWAMENGGYVSETTTQYQHVLEFMAYDMNAATEVGDRTTTCSITYTNTNSGDESIDFNYDLSDAEINRLVGKTVIFDGWYDDEIVSIGQQDFNSIDTANGLCLVVDTSSDMTDTVTQVGGNSGGSSGTQYCHTITFEDNCGQTYTMNLVNNSPTSLTGNYEGQTTHIYDDAEIIIDGIKYVVVGFYGAGNYDEEGNTEYYVDTLQLEDPSGDNGGMQIEVYYGDFTDTVTEYGGTEDTIEFYVSHLNEPTGTYTAPKNSTWADFVQTCDDFIEESGEIAFCAIEGENVRYSDGTDVSIYDPILIGYTYHCGG